MLKPLFKSIAVRSGAPSLVRAARGSAFRILMYHRFPGEAGQMEEHLAAQCQHLRRNYEPVSMRQAGAALAGGERLPDRALAITVDDGYADFQRGWKVFRAHRLPVTLYAVSGFIDRKLWLWPDVVHYALSHARIPAITVPIRGAEPFVHSLGNADERKAAEIGLDARLIEAPNEARVAAIDALPEITGVEIPGEFSEGTAPLTWEQLRDLAQEGAEIGAHTIHHPILSRLESTEALRDEIGGSKRRVEEAMGRPVLHFCFPNGKEPDYTEETRAIVRECGFQTAVNAQRGLNRKGADATNLRRIGVDPSTPLERFQMEVAGFRMP